MKIPVLLNLATAASLLVFSVSGEARTWTQAASKKTIEADFVKVVDGKVTINMKGREMTIPVTSLIKEDQDFIKTQGAAKDGAAKAGSKEMPKGPTSVVLTGAHVCCSKCEKGMEKAIERYDDIKLVFDKDAGTVTFNGESGQSVEDALFKIHDAGYYGSTDHARLKMKKLGGSTKEMEEADVSGLHNCCGKCEKAIKNALKTVKGIDEHTLDKGKTSFKITGKFTIAEVMKALGDAGMAATIRAPRK